jgi:hypothetical protein
MTCYQEVVSEQDKDIWSIDAFAKINMWINKTITTREWRHLEPHNQYNSLCCFK